MRLGPRVNLAGSYRLERASLRSTNSKNINAFFLKIHIKTHLGR